MDIYIYIYNLLC